jgi:hypothetical protein
MIDSEYSLPLDQDIGLETRPYIKVRVTQSLSTTLISPSTMSIIIGVRCHPPLPSARSIRESAGQLVGDK